jgi:hypothetical protein
MEVSIDRSKDLTKGSGVPFLIEEKYFHPKAKTFFTKIF